MKRIFIILGIAACTFVSCNDVPIPGPKGTSNVYVAGREGNVAKYWKNGVGTNLTNGVNDARAYSIFVSGSDVHVAGSEYYGKNRYRAKYWKNGKATNLTDGSKDADARSVVFFRSNVYVAGHEDHKAKYWKNGVATTLSDAYSYATSIFVSGPDVYVAGYAQDDDYQFQATYWKNGVETTLTDEGGYAHSIFVLGSDVYVSGATTHPSGNSEYATYWKNGVATNLSVGLSSAYSIFVSGSDVYAAGYTAANGPVYWKNGVLTSFDAGGWAYSIFVSGSDIYVSGYASGFNGPHLATYWKNDSPTTLSNVSTSIGHSIFVHEITSVDSYANSLE